MIKALLGGGMYLLFIVGVIWKWQSKRKSDSPEEKAKGKPTPEAYAQIDDPIAALADPHWQIRLSATQRLLEQPTAEAMPALVGALDDSDPDVRQGASDALVKLGDDVIPQVIAVLESRSLDARIAAIQTLAGLQSPPTVEGLSHALLHDDSIWVRLPAIEALQHHPQQDIIVTLIAALKDSNREVYDAVADALREIGTDEALAAIDQHPYQPGKNRHQDGLEERY